MVEALVALPLYVCFDSGNSQFIAPIARAERTETIFET